MDNLINYLEKYYDRKLIKTELTEEEQEELEYLQSFLKSFDINNPHSVFGMDGRKYLISAIRAANPNKNFRLLKQDLEAIDESIIEICDYHEIAEINECLITFVKEDSFSLLEKLPFLDNYNDDNLEIIKKLKEKGLLETAKKLHTLLKRHIGKNEEQRKLIIKVFKEYKGLLFVILSGVAAIHETAKELNFVKKEEPQIKKKDPLLIDLSITKSYITPSLDRDFNSLNLDDRQSKKALRKLLETVYIISFNEKINERVSYLKSLPNTREKENNSNKRKKDKLISQLR